MPSNFPPINHSFIERSRSCTFSLSLPILSLSLSSCTSETLLLCVKKVNHLHLGFLLQSFQFHFTFLGFLHFVFNSVQLHQAGSFFLLHNCCWIWCFDHTLDFSWCVSCFMNDTFPIWWVIFLRGVISFVLD